MHYKSTKRGGTNMRRRGLRKLIAVVMLLVMAVSAMPQSVFAAPKTDSVYGVSGDLAPTNDAAGNGWIALGGEGFSKGAAHYTSIALDKNNVPYVVFVDGGNGNAATVKRYTGSGWETVGKEGFTPKNVKNTKIVIDKNNTPYVVYVEESSNKIVASKFANGKWTSIGSLVGYGDEAALAVDSKGTPYVAYTYSTKNILCGLNLSGIVVSKYVLGVWLPEFSLGSVQKNNLYSAPSIAFDAKGNPYVAFNNDGINVMKASGFGWSCINIGGKPAKASVKDVTLAIDKDGKTYVAYQDNKGRAVVSKNKKDEYWEVSDGKAEFVSLALDKDGTPYVAFVESKGGDKAVVKKLEDGNWITVGDGSLSKGKAKYTSIAVDSEGSVYVAYQNNDEKKKATVSKYTNKFVVTFNTDGGTEIPEQYVPYNGKVERPEDPVKEGYVFENWYTDSSFKKVYDFDTPVKGNLTLYAKYKKIKTATLKIKWEGDGSVSGWENGEEKVFTAGSTVSLKAEADKNSKFMYWKDSSGRVISSNPEYTFELGVNETLTAYFLEKSKYLVTFKNGNGEIIQSVYFWEDEEVVFPKPPAMFGYTFIGWDKTAEEIQEAQKNVVVTALFEKIEKTVTVEVYGGSGSGQYNLKDYVIVVADEPEEGKKFAYWEDENGNILSYYAKYGFTATRDIVLTAVFVSESDEYEEEATISITNITITDERISFVAERSIPAGNTIIVHEIIATNDPSIGESEDEFVLENDGVYKAKALTTGLVGIFVLNKSTELNETWYARGYVVYKDSEGDVHTIYSDIVQATRE